MRVEKIGCKICQRGHMRTNGIAHPPVEQARLKNKLSGPGSPRYHKMYPIPIEMAQIVFRIISTDRVILDRWQAAFRGEGWETVRSGSCQDDEANTGNRASIYLIEIGTADCTAIEQLLVMKQKLMPLSVLAFGERTHVSNRQIAAFLDAGADDFIYKDLDERILVAKLKAHIRRIMPAIQETTARCVTCCGDIEVDNERRAVKIKERPGKFTELLNLTKKELDILAFLIWHEKKVVTRENILEKLWGDGAENVYSECVDKHIESLRRKLGLYGRRIKTVYGAGYMLTEEK